MGRAGVWIVAAAALLAAAVLTVLGVGDSADALPNWQAFVLGVVQGATELLPISSSGHLILVPWLGDWDYLKEHEAFNQTFDVALHLGTLVAVVGYFWHDISRLVAAWVGTLRRAAASRRPTSGSPGSWSSATMPAAVVGLLGEDLIAEHLGRAVADRDRARVLRRRALGRRPAAAASGRWGPESQGRAGHGARAEPRARCRASRARASRSPRAGSSGSTATRRRGSRSCCSFRSRLGAVVLKGVTDVLLGDLPPGSAGPFLVGMLAAVAAAGCWRSPALLGYVRRHDYSIFVWYRLSSRRSSCS